MKEPLLCRLGFYKWQNYGNEVEVFWQEPTWTRGIIDDNYGLGGGALRKEGLETAVKGFMKGTRAKDVA